MTSDLYRTCPTCGGNGDIMTPAGYHDQCPVCSAWGVVPVTIDYEAAADEMLRIVDEFIENEMGLAATPSARRVVDAALGERR